MSGLMLLLAVAFADEPEVIVAGETPLDEPGIELGGGATLALSGFVDVGWFDAAGARRGLRGRG